MCTYIMPTIMMQIDFCYDASNWCETQSMIENTKISLFQNATFAAICLLFVKKWAWLGPHGQGQIQNWAILRRLLWPSRLNRAVYNLPDISILTWMVSTCRAYNMPICLFYHGMSTWNESWIDSKQSPQAKIPLWFKNRPVRFSICLISLMFWWIALAS